MSVGGLQAEENVFNMQEGHGVRPWALWSDQPKIKSWLGHLLCGVRQITSPLWTRDNKNT